MKKELLFSLMLGLLLIPGISLASYDLGTQEAPIPTLYNESAISDKAVPTLISNKLLVKEPRLISAEPTLYAELISNSSSSPNSAYDALMLMSTKGLGVTQKDYERFKKNIPSNLDGRIILNVEDRGKAYIVDYKNKELIYLAKPDNALVALKNYFSSVLGDSIADDPKNCTYIIDGERFTLVDGEVKKEITSGSASKISVKVFDSWSTEGDVNGDGREDLLVLLTYNGGGGGTFYYVAIAINSDEGYSGTNAVLIGDRIAPQTSEIRDREIIVNYADRKPWESFSNRPSVGKSKYLVFKNNILVEKEREALSKDNAFKIISKSIDENQIDNLSVNILDGRDGVWYIEYTIDNIKDDSVFSFRKIYSVYYSGGAWKLGSEQLVEYACQDGRGQEEFSEELYR